jgi:HlyD family secretion protein
MKQKAVPILIVAGIILLALAYFGFSTFSRFQKEAKEKSKTQQENTYVVSKGDVSVEVVETGPLEPLRVVEVKSRVQGRVKELLVDEGDMVQEGQLVAVIDPQETELQVQQNEAQLRGAQASVDRIDVDLSQRRVTAAANLARAQSRLRQVEMELKQQPILSSATIRSAESALASAEQGLDLLIRVTQPNTRSQVESAVTEAESNLNNSKLEYDRRKSLLDNGYISRREFEQAELNLQLAATRVANAKERLSHLDRELQLEKNQAQERVKQARQELARAKANQVQDSVKVEERRQAIQSLRDAEAGLKDVQGLLANRRQQLASVDQLSSVLSDARRQLGETEIRSPVTGIVSKRLVQLGELVSSLSSFSSGTPIFRVEDRSAMKVKLNVNEIDVAKLRLDTKASIRIDAFPDETYTGSITKISPSSNDSAPGAAGGDPVVKYAVEVTLNGSPRNLKSGMSALCTMTVASAAGALRVRTDFLGQNPDKSYFVEIVQDEKKLDKEGRPTVKKTPVKVGPSSGAFTAVLSGVKEGDKLYKPKFTGPPRKTFFQDGDEQKQAEEKQKEEAEIKKRKEEEGAAEGP